MSTADVQQAPAPAVPDYLADPNAVLKDTAAWRYGKAPDYSNTRNVYEQTKKHNHEAGSLPSLVENLVKNWEVEASFKKELSDWRTIDHSNYTFAINGGPPQSAEHMLKVGTYNAIIASNEFYSPANSDFASSHKTFKRMMPTFAWEVVEVYSGPPKVAFKWRHWGQMKNDYVGFNDKGEKITAKAHGGQIDIEGVTVAHVDDQVRLQKVETWFDPLEMFRQIAPNGIVNKEIRSGTNEDEPEDDSHHEAQEETQDKEGPEDGATRKAERIENDSEQEVLGGNKIAKISLQEAQSEADGLLHDPPDDGVTKDDQEHIQGKVEREKISEDRSIRPEKPTASRTAAADIREPSPNNSSVASNSAEGKAKAFPGHPTEPTPGNALATAPDSEETKRVHEEMSTVTPAECPFLMNKE